LLQLVTLILTVTPAINNTVRFGFMVLGPAVCGLLFAAWLLLFSRLRWRDRMAILSGSILAGILAGQGIDSTMGVALWIYGVPLAMALTTAVLWMGRRWKPLRRTSTVLVVVAGGWGLFATARLEGFDGSYWPELRWRWIASREQRFAGNSPSKATVGDVAPMALEASAEDWPGFRGPTRDGRVRRTRISADWTATPPRELWRMAVGPAWSSFAAVGNRLFTQEQRGESEVVVCYDADSGAEIWRHADITRFADVVSGAGPRATPTFADGRLYTFGGRAVLSCLDGSTGTLLWQRDLMTEIDAQLPVWGFAASPLVSRGVVIVYAGGSAGRGLVAYEATTGEPRWHVAGSGMNFSSAQPVTLADRELVLFASTAKLVAVDPATGSVVWDYQHHGQRSMAIVQPQQISSRSIIVPFGDGGGLARIDVELVDNVWQVAERWRTRSLKPSFNDFVYYEGHLYGFDQNIFTCINAETGQRCWKRGRYGFGQVILFDEQGLLLITTEQGEIVLLEANPEQHVELIRLAALTGKTWNHPVVARNRLVVRNGVEAVCYDLSAAAQ
jgi:outer membrane protein assembly factor BamB